MSKVEIKAAALELFATKGYEGTTMREIGDKVGIKGASIYYHFKSKEDIFLDIVNDLIKKFTWESINIDKVRTDGKYTSIRSMLFEVFKGYYLFFAKNRIDLLFWQRIRFFPPAGLEKKYDVNNLIYNRPTLEIYIDLFKKGIENKEIKEAHVGVLVMSFFAFISGFTDSLIIVPYKLTEEELLMAFENFWSGIKS